MKQCNFCGIKEDKLQCCAQCRKVNYCSRACQKNDWSSHKEECKKKSTKSRLEKAVRQDVMEGTMPIPMNLTCLKSANEYGLHNGGHPVEIQCHCCGSRTKELYSFLQSKHALECIDCPVKAAEKANVPLGRVTEFIDGRYRGSIEACSIIQGFC